MNLYWIKTNWLIKKWFSEYFWDIPNTNNSVYLTFDDGPTPEITPWVLEVLKQNDIKATFFCVGNNIKKHPEIVQQIISDGHRIGNHTLDHVKGWQTETKKYIENITLCETIIEQQLANDTGFKSHTESKIFRPPYGKITAKQSEKVLGLGYKIIMWDVLTIDYDKNITPSQCLKNATQKVNSGSIIVFHDSIKAFENLEYTLPKAITIWKEKGFNFDVID